MKPIRLPMGCLSSRSSVTPSDRVVEAKGLRAKSRGPAGQLSNGQSNPGTRADNSRNTNNQYQGALRNMIDGGGASSSHINNGNDNDNNISNNSNRKKTTISRDNSLGSSVDTADDDIMSLLMEDQNGGGTGHKSKHRKSGDDRLSPEQDQRLSDGISGGGGRKPPLDTENNSLNGDGDGDGDDRSAGADEDEEGNALVPSKRNESSFDVVEPDMELLRQYVAIEYEINQLEDRDALRVYHEKIEQLEQLERELDMISSEVEEVAGRSNTGTEVSRAPSVTGDGQNNMDSKLDTETNSMISGVSGNTSQRSWMLNGADHHNNTTNQNNNKSPNKASLKTTATTDRGGKGGSAAGSQVAPSMRGRSYAGSQPGGGGGGGGPNGNRLISYSTVEEVFNRKIILEKERDKLKKDVELVIAECDKLQTRYKKRDAILDKLFDGRTGNGLENHLEQQLNWLLEQKHYVDQVFYAWKRAETLTSQTCEQFASALKMLEKLPKIGQPEERAETVKSIERLLTKSRQDMEQAQRYNPNVDAPFFTDNETERFDKIINTIQSEQINPSDYSQILTVIQFAYKRAVSIRLWLEQILQTTIARDSFELTEEYKWIAIQLRKERINLIKSKLQESPYRSMARSVLDQMAHQQSIADRRQQQQHQHQQHEVNRDSGIESEPNDLDIEVEIYRVLEMNKSRLESIAATMPPRADHSSMTKSSNSATLPNLQIQPQPQSQSQQRLRVTQQTLGGALSSASGSESNQRDQMMQDRVKKRVRGAHQLHLDQVEPPMLPATTTNRDSAAGRDTPRGANRDSRLRGASPTPTKLKVELDEEARQSLLKQVDQIHVRHKDRMERLRGSTRAKATEFITSKMQRARQSASALAEQQQQR